MLLFYFHFLTVSCFLDSISYALILSRSIRKLPFSRSISVDNCNIIASRFFHTSLSVYPDEDNLEYDDDDDDADEDEPVGYLARVIDDFVMKRYGAGEAWYGKRISDISDEEYKKKLNQQQLKQKKALRDNAILIVGATEEIGQWLTFELSDKGFNVRVSCRDKKEGIKRFGMPGSNVEILQLSAEKTRTRKYARAVDGCQAIVICINFSPFLAFPPFMKKGREEIETARQILDVCIRAKKQGSKQIQKVLLVSRYLPDSFISSINEPNPIASAINNIANSRIYEQFRSLHKELEDVIRASPFDYMIVRAPPQVDIARKPTKYALSLIENNLFSNRETLSENINSLNLNDDTDVEVEEEKESSEETSPNEMKSALAPRIGILDLSEVITQALIQDVSDVTFLVAETNSIDGSKYKINDLFANTARIPRKNYYKIIDDEDSRSEDEGVRMSNLMKSPDVYNAQVKEDIRVEKYWLNRLKLMRKDKY